MTLETFQELDHRTQNEYFLDFLDQHPEFPSGKPIEDSEEFQEWLDE